MQGRLNPGTLYEVDSGELEEPGPARVGGRGNEAIFVYNVLDYHRFPNWEKTLPTQAVNFRKKKKRYNTGMRPYYRWRINNGRSPTLTLLVHKVHGTHHSRSACSV